MSDKAQLDAYGKFRRRQADHHEPDPAAHDRLRDLVGVEAFDALHRAGYLAISRADVAAAARGLEASMPGGAPELVARLRAALERGRR